jgi:hypothetical protein
MTLSKYIFLFPSTLFNNKFPFRPTPLCPCLNVSAHVSLYYPL